MKAAIIGSGYTGMELLKLLLQHPYARVTAVASKNNAGKKVGEVHPAFDGATDLEYAGVAVEELAEENDVLFFAVPHTTAMTQVPQAFGTVKVIDLSADYRLSAEQFEEWYGAKHASPELLEKAVYGLPELYAQKIKSAELVANPGCFATAVIIALAPFANTIKSAYVDAKTGSSGSGAKPSEKTHHPKREGNVIPYKPFSHQHAPEVENALGVKPLMVAHSLPVVRGIHASCYVELSEEKTKKELLGEYADYYSAAKFVRVKNSLPDLGGVVHSNYCDVGLEVQGKHAVVFSALDNLVKGAAGQAVQNMNLMFGLDETTGLKAIGGLP